jgi:hypothetical protein
MLAKQAFLMVFLNGIFHASWGLCQFGSPRFTMDVVAVGSELVADASLVTMRNLAISSYGMGGSEISIDPVGSPSAGLMKISGAPGRVIRISFVPNEIIYSDQNDSTKVDVTYKVSGCPIENQRASSVFETPNSTVTLHETNGSYFLWIGGIFNLENARSGKYKSQFVLTIDEL